jgi:hypothetical protein
MKSRDLALVAIFLAIGAVIYVFIPNTGVVTPDTVVTFAALAIMLVMPRPLVGFGIGIVAGLLGMWFSKSPAPWLNIPTHALGAWSTAVVCLKVGELKTGKLAWKPAVGVLAYCVVSGGLFITAFFVMGFIPNFQVYLAGWGQVLLMTLYSIIICMILYPPAKALYDRTG